MKRRALISSFGMGIVGSSGCLRLQSDSGESQQSNDDDEQSSQSVSLTEHWTIEPDLDYIWTQNGDFFFNGYGWAGATNPGGGLRWKQEIKTQEDNPADSANVFAFDQNSRYLILGYYPDPSPSDPANEEFVTGHFVAFDRQTPGSVGWTHVAPEANGENFPIGATIIDGVAILAVSYYEQTEDPWIAGVDLETGEEIWQLDTPGNGVVSPVFVGKYDSNAYIGVFGTNAEYQGVQVVAPDTGSVIEANDRWSIGKTNLTSGGTIHGSTLFAMSTDRNGVRAYPLDNTGLEWSIELESNVATGVSVDTALVVVGTDTGQVHALERDSGETRWSASVPQEVDSISVSERHVWATNPDAGLYAFDRTTGEELHNSVQPIDNSHIAVASNVIAFGDGRAFTINE